MGIDNITYAKHISSLGTGDTVGFLEEIGYTTASGGRPPEMLSAYVGLQQTFGEMFNIVIGIGRGRFVGYGERSRYFNTDLFVLGDDYITEEHSSWALGLFLGTSLRFPFGLEFMVEMDGRDASIGMRSAHARAAIRYASPRSRSLARPGARSSLLSRIREG